jgi:nucleotide-binding universal stress UspA family protein
MKVIFAVDSEACIKPFVEFAAKQKWDAPVSFKLINVVEPLLVGSYMSVFPSPLLEDMRTDMFKRGKLIMKELSEQLTEACKGAEVVKQSIEGFPATSIAQEARDWKADLIVTGTHGRQGFQRVLMGSESSEIASHAPCSVLILQLKKASKDENVQQESASQNQKKEQPANC